jgi:hypothetical protein
MASRRYYVDDKVSALKSPKPFPSTMLGVEKAGNGREMREERRRRWRRRLMR